MRRKMEGFSVIKVHREVYPRIQASGEPYRLCETGIPKGKYNMPSYNDDIKKKRLPDRNRSVYIECVGS